MVADLARRGQTLPDVRSTACWTVPAHVSMFAGALPRALGFADQAGLTPHNARPIVEALRERLIAEVLRRAGYRTAGASANAWISSHSGFATGFERFVDSLEGRRGRMYARSIRERGRWVLEAARARVDDGARAAELQIEDWIAQAAREPFFWFVNLVECHSPYLPPKPWAELSALGRAKAAREAAQWLTQGGVWRSCVTATVPEHEVLERMRAGYRGAIRYMDDWLGRVLERLDGAGLLESTLVLVSSDHGENFGEGGLIGHGFSLDERLIRVPFVAAGPGSERLRGVRSFVELPGTLAEIAGIPEHPYDGNAIPPLPVAQFDSPAPPRGDPRTEDTIQLWGLDDAGIDRMLTPKLAIVDNGIKMIVGGETETFYDLQADPLEQAPLRADRVDAEVLERLRTAAKHPTVTASEARLQAEPAPVPAAMGDDLADLEERMKLLGYL